MVYALKVWLIGMIGVSFSINNRCFGFPFIEFIPFSCFVL